MCKDIIINLPIFLTFVSFLKLENFYLNIPVLVITIIDEVVFRYLYFLMFSKNIVTIIVNALLYGIYAYFWIRDITGLLGYFSLGFIFSFSSKKYSVFQLCIFRYIINLHCVQ